MGNTNSDKQNGVRRQTQQPHANNSSSALHFERPARTIIRVVGAVTNAELTARTASSSRAVKRIVVLYKPLKVIVEVWSNWFCNKGRGESGRKGSPSVISEMLDILTTRSGAEDRFSTR